MKPTQLNPERARPGELDRRRFVGWVTAGSLALSAGVMSLFNLIFLRPRVTYGPPSKFRVGRPDSYSLGSEVVFSNARVVVRRRENGFAAISMVCTHLGCTVGSKPSGFDCPCHGSSYDDLGDVVAGPAPERLEWFRIGVAPNGELEVDKRQRVPAGTYMEVRA